MNKLKLVLLIGIVSVYSITLQAQYIIEQLEYNIPLNYELVPEDVELENPIEEARFFLQVSDSKLRDMSQKEFGDIEMIASTIYIDGDNFTVESSSQEEGKTTVIFNQNKGIIYYVIWAQEKIYVISDEDMAGIQKGVNAAMLKVMEQLPPELQEQAKMATQNNNKQQITATGREMVKYGQKCSEYFVEDEEDVMVIWAAEDTMGLLAKVKSMSEKLAELFPGMEEEERDEWEVIAGKIPVETRSYHSNGMEGAEIEVQAITRITKTKPSADKFILPAEAVGFQRSSFKEMMGEMQELLQGMEEGFE
ncbi:hypothetical protein BZG02_03115 [Labilibaculum filiforme]|uniref:DUF4412 domain-containing protein n=1 Tax=Labilibaculum filiforme TaxID=1940526 RepID=A0A2N3I3H1_9BACT|nr:hypothetical protein [Labilibaculum filiforme]PKQ64857.1 hypothetical protein BZG02_03115 [Labilibaculum filiforme]